MGAKISVEQPKWQDIAAAKRSENLAKIPLEWRLDDSVIADAREQKKLAGAFIEGLLDPETLTVTSLEVEEILRQVQNGSLTSVQVTQAFCKRGAIAHQLNQNLIEVNFSGALERARELDLYFKNHQKTVGPLHGLPFSMKDQWDVKGLDTSMGYVGWIGTFRGRKDMDKNKKSESELVREMYELGAILTAKTTLVQSLWAGETNNNILGYLWNPQIQTLSSGGSSGGEGAFQALRGSAIGFGSSIGGSVAMPAAFNGVTSFKPSHGRISFKGAANSSPGQMVIPTVVGMMGPSVESLRLTFQALLSGKPWLHDPEVLPIPYRFEDEVHPKAPSELSFGIFEADGVVTPHPPILRAIRMTANALEAQGYHTFPWEPPPHEESMQLHPIITRGDGGPDVIENVKLSGEPLVPQIEDLYLNPASSPITLHEFYNKTVQVQEFRSKYQEYWRSTAEKTPSEQPADAVILPVAPHAAVIPGKFYYYSYSSIVNVLDYTTVVIPVTTASSSIDLFDDKYQPLNEKDEKNWKAYDPEKYDGAPASIQIVGRRLDEEKLLSVAKLVVEALSKFDG